MPVSGYDPDDVDDALESLLDERDARALLDEGEWAAYREGESLVDLLDESEIHALLGEDEGVRDGEEDEAVRDHGGSDDERG